MDRARLRVLIAATLAALVAANAASGRLPLWIAAAYAAAGILSAFLYGMDKARARAGHWRIDEARLHGVDLCGGIIGGLLAQAVFRHKTLKTGFAVGSFAIAALHAAALSIILAGMGGRMVAALQTFSAPLPSLSPAG